MLHIKHNYLLFFNLILIYYILFDFTIRYRNILLENKFTYVHVLPCCNYFIKNMAFLSPTVLINSESYQLLHLVLN